MGMELEDREDHFEENSEMRSESLEFLEIRTQPVAYLRGLVVVPNLIKPIGAGDRPVYIRSQGPPSRTVLGREESLNKLS